MPIYFAWFTTALLSVGGDANDQNLPQSGRLLYCVGRGFLDTYPVRGVRLPPNVVSDHPTNHELAKLMVPSAQPPNPKVTPFVRRLVLSCCNEQL
jgi:hypothetical protein